LEPTIVGAFISGVFLTLAGALGVFLKFRNDLKAEYDKELRTARVEAYQRLWQIQQNLARYDLPEPLTPRRLKELSEEMRDW
jgi:hypothetical protein